MAHPLRPGGRRHSDTVMLWPGERTALDRPLERVADGGVTEHAQDERLRGGERSAGHSVNFAKL